MKTFIKKYLGDSLSYSVVFFLGYLVACSGGSGGNLGGIGPIGGAGGSIPQRMHSSSLHRSVILPTNTSQPVLASIFQVSPHIAISNPSQVAQSYDSRCDSYGVIASGVPDAIHNAFGNSGLVSLNFNNGNLCRTVLTSVGSDENGTPMGFPVIFDGTVNTLVAYGRFVSGKPFRCTDTANSSAVKDNSFLRAYYDLGHDAILVGNGSTQLSVTCSIAVPPGDDVQDLTVQWIKS